MMRRMRRGLIAWVSTLVLAVVGTQLAHALAYRLTTPDAHDRGQLLTATGHGYLTYAPLALALGFGVLVAVLLAEVRAAARRRGTQACAWRFAFVAPVVFAAQEHLERLAHDGAIPWSTALQGTFLAGLALQLPFALAAYLLARLLLSMARALGRRLIDRAPPRSAPVPEPAFPRIQPRAPRVAALALGYGERGPPPFA